MALQVKEDWIQFFIAAGILDDAANHYATTFVENCITESLLPQLDLQFLTQLGITITGDILCILKETKQQQTSPSSFPPTDITTTPSTTKSTPVNPPNVLPEMTHLQFQKFKIDWDVFKQITTIPPCQIAAQLYNLCDNTVQNALTNTVSDKFQLSETDLLKSIESVFTKRSNPTVHQMHFGTITKSPSESIQDYIVRLKSAAIDCEFSCPRCQCDLVPLHVKDQFICGLFNNTSQTDILVKAAHLQTLEQLHIQKLLKQLYEIS